LAHSQQRLRARPAHRDHQAVALSEEAAAAVVVALGNLFVPLDEKKDLKEKIPFRSIVLAFVQ